MKCIKYKVIYYTSGKVRIDFNTYKNLNDATKRINELKEIQQKFWQYSIIVEISNNSIF